MNVKSVRSVGNSGWENSPPVEGWRKFKEFLTGWFNDYEL